ncbi:hypothetical protein ACIQF6_31175 [Kitasatospora sp. NPDC092948]|uniref:hypothetical protein n=1 Tax=Kitasatospora sp. NPDC092948 TaxID=3364088 RepID=UPI00380A3221
MEQGRRVADRFGLFRASGPAGDMPRKSVVLLGGDERASWLVTVPAAAAVVELLDSPLLGARRSHPA